MGEDERFYHVTGQEDPAQIHVRDLTDGSLAGVTNGATAARVPRWSPEGPRTPLLSPSPPALMPPIV
jgi:hypothetical protein